MRIRAPVFAPPRVPVDADLTWLLHAAFADSADTPLPENAERALQMARATQLSGRVAARVGAWRGAPSLGTLGQALGEDYFANVANETLVMQAQERVADLAERLSIPSIAVKFAGLRLAGVIARGSRVVADIDVLLPSSSARELWRALLASGFRRTNTHEYPHQLEALLDPYGAFIDIHVHLPGVILEQGWFATAAQLMAHGLVTRVDGPMLIPSAPVLAAHAIAHALLQNRSTPQTYSPLRLLADILDLRGRDARVVLSAKHYLAPELGATCDTLERLCAYLAAGTFDGPAFNGTPEQILLWHCVAARLDIAYAERLRAGGLSNKFRDGSSAKDIARYIADLVYPAESALDVLYGPAVGPIARVRRRLHRPFDLAKRAVHRALRSRPR